ncbi:MAG: hypothetical protein HY352_05930 [Candidatus Omnitrophica bacterium]|nr:hypothetical protein [Candidatus Omnitrophota bacterium]
MLSGVFVLLVLALGQSNATFGDETPVDPMDYSVQVVYFVPADRAPLDQYETRLTTAVDFIQQFFEREMAHHGYGFKTFRVESDPVTGAPLIHFVQGQHPASYYCPEVMRRVTAEVETALPFIRGNGRRLIFGHTWDVDPKTKLGFCGTAEGGDPNTLIDVPFTRPDTMALDTAGQLKAFCDSTRSGAYEPGSPERYPDEASVGELASRHFGGTAHEMGHAFGLLHQCYQQWDDRDHSVPAVMCMGFTEFRRVFTPPTPERPPDGLPDCGKVPEAPVLTEDDAAWLDLSRYFNPPRIYTDNTPPTGSFVRPTETEVIVIPKAQTTLPVQVHLRDEGGSGLGYVRFGRGNAHGDSAVNGVSLKHTDTNEATVDFTFEDLTPGVFWDLHADVLDRDGNSAPLTNRIKVFTDPGGIFKRVYLLDRPFEYPERLTDPTDPSPLAAPLARDYLDGESSIADVRDGNRLAERTWRTVSATSQLTFDLNALRVGQAFSVAYAYAEVLSPRQIDAELRVGSDDAMRIWLNGQQVHNTLVIRGTEFDQDRIPITLQAGVNRFLFKILNYESGFGFQARVCHPVTGLGFEELQFQSPAASQPPTLDPLSAAEVDEGQLLRFTVAARDPDDQPLQFQAAPLPAGASVHLLGDVTLDGAVDEADAFLIEQYLLGLTVLTAEALDLADVDESGAITQADAVFIQQISAGSVPPLNKARFLWTPSYVQAGNYPMTITATDPDGLRASGEVLVTVRDVPLRIGQLQASPDPFSPHEAGRPDKQVKITASFNRPAAAWSLKIHDAAGHLVRTFKKSSNQQATVTQSWDGRDNGGQVLPDGVYRYTVVAFDEEANKVKQSSSITIDGTPPRVKQLRDDPDPFQLRQGQYITIRYRLSEPAFVTLDIWSRTGAFVRSLRSATLQSRGSRRWDGKDEGGAFVPAGVYRYKLWVVDQAGNPASPLPAEGTVTVK